MLHVSKMIESKASYQNYGIAGQPNTREGRLAAGPALLAVFALSLVGWAFVLAPLVAILHR